MRQSPGIVVVGASAAGLAAVEELRRGGYDGTLSLIGEEAHLPYDRPPLSKKLLDGGCGPDDLRLRSADVYDDLGVERRMGIRAEGLDVAGHTVHLAGGERLEYSSLVVATGARARTLPGAAGIPGVHQLRTVEDGLALRQDLATRPHLVIVGGGFIGAEAAAVARSLGCEVTLVTRGRTPLGDALGDEIGEMLAAVHREHGIRIISGTSVTAILTDQGRVDGVRLDDGRLLEAGAVLVGIGAVPNKGWLAGSGIALSAGVDCDPVLCAAQDVWAAGDVASWPDPESGRRLRIEHRTNATEQGMAVARNILAGHAAAAPFTSVPFVWSDQYDLKIQIHGHTRGADEVRLVDGSVDDRKLTALYLRDGQVAAALGINMFRPVRSLRPLVAARTPVDEALEGLSVHA